MTALAFEVAAGTTAQPPLVLGVRLIPSAWGMKVLGHPLGSDAYCRHYFAKVAANTEEAVVAIKRKCPPPPRCALPHHWLASPMIIARGNAWGNAGEILPVL